LNKYLFRPLVPGARQFLINLESSVRIDMYLLRQFTEAGHMQLAKWEKVPSDLRKHFFDLEYVLLDGDRVVLSETGREVRGYKEM
jgi:hypothetical protein